MTVKDCSTCYYKGLPSSSDMFEYSCKTCRHLEYDTLTKKSEWKYYNYCSDSKTFWQDNPEVQPVKQEHDPVSRPRHYLLFEDKNIEVRDVIDKLVVKMYLKSPPVSPMAYADYVQLMQYLMRFMDKNGLEDLKKARWYLDKLIGAYES